MEVSNTPTNAAYSASASLRMNVSEGVIKKAGIKL